MTNTQASDNQTQWEKIDCPICAGKTFQHLFEKAGEPFVRCDSCGLILINPRPVYTQVLNTYDQSYSEGYITKAEKKRKRAQRHVGRIVAKYKSSGRWLDVGCSAGFVVQAAQQHGFDAYGVDVETGGVRYSQEVLGLKNTAQGTLEAQHYPSAYFDVMTIYDVIEHVQDLNQFVAELKRLLAPGGVIEIRTPDVGHWRVPKKLQDWEDIKPSEHLYYFSRSTLTRLLEQHGLRVIKNCFNLKTGLHVYAGHAAG